MRIKKFHQKILIGLKLIDKYKLSKIEGLFRKQAQNNKKMHEETKARRDMSERVYKVGSIFQQNGDFDVTVGKRDAKSLSEIGVTSL